MASGADARAPTEDLGSPRKGDLHQDVEVGSEMVDIERIEKVYA